jgi:hypothetical protein
MKKTRGNFEKYLNEFEIPTEDKKSNGGLIPDTSKYGTWLRRNKSICQVVRHTLRI